MKHVIIGTAGHVDHGKTLLIKSLTGIDTDRLIEEKKRGITIELGFAHLDWPDGLQAGIVDVPGHEKFIKNMLAGAGGIDLAMLVVAADEGFMPQTVEHLNILTLLGIKDGLVVITKTDTVDPEWLIMMEDEIHTRVAGTFLAGKPILPVSAYTGDGIDVLRDHLYTLVQQASEKNMRAPFRLPVDRIFSVDGFGTVVTGTLTDGCMQEGERAMLMPSGKESRIRNLQVHGKPVQMAYAGQRVAVNLAGLKKSDIQRGDCVARPDSIRTSLMLDVSLQNLKNSPRIITNNMQVHLYHGGTVVLAKVVLLDRDTLKQGEVCYAQLRMTDEISTKNGDRFVIRFYSPVETIGGGIILDDCPLRHRRNIPSVLEALRIKETGSSSDRVIQTITEFGTSLPTTAQLSAKLGSEPETVTLELNQLTASGRITTPLIDRFVSASILDTLGDTARNTLGVYHQKNPLHAGIRTAELRQKLFPSTDQTIADALLLQLCREGVLQPVSERYALSDFSIHFTKRQTAIRQKLLTYYERAGIEPNFVDVVMDDFPLKEHPDVKQVLDSLFTGGDLIMLTPQICLHQTAYLHVCQLINAHFTSNDNCTVAELRDVLSSSRKYTIALLEYFDRHRITTKDGDYRRLNLGFPHLSTPEIEKITNLDL